MAETLKVAAGHRKVTREEILAAVAQRDVPGGDGSQSSTSCPRYVTTTVAFMSVGWRVQT